MIWPGLRKSSARAVGEASVRHARARSCAEIPVVTDGSLESTEIVYAVPFGSAFSSTIWGRLSRLAISGDTGAQIKPLVRGKIG